ncbi:MAG: phage major capsid protein, partial [Proteobacteria bacterium]|nr:phage major capsid protein [Pseudomonadota bacterium]
MNHEQFERAAFAIFERQIARSSIMDSNARAYSQLLRRGVGEEFIDGKAADFALRQHNELSAVCGDAPHGGFWMPLVSRPQTRDLNASTGAALIATHVDASMIPSLVPQSAVIASGARIVPVNSAGAFALPRIATGATVSVTADGSMAAGGDPTNDQCVITPFTISATIKVSRRLSVQSVFGTMLESAISGDLQKMAFAELDRLILAGAGTGEPQGIIGNTDVAAYAAGINGAAPTPAMLNAMENELGRAYSGGALTWFINSAMRKTVREVATGAGLAPLWSDDNALLGYSTV